MPFTCFQQKTRSITFPLGHQGPTQSQHAETFVFERQLICPMIQQPAYLHLAGLLVADQRSIVRVLTFAGGPCLCLRSCIRDHSLVLQSIALVESRPLVFTLCDNNQAVGQKSVPQMEPGSWNHRLRSCRLDPYPMPIRSGLVALWFTAHVVRQLLVIKTRS